MVVVFVLGYTAIALEHPLKVDKAASALIIGSLCWVIYILGAEPILHLGVSPAWESFMAAHPNAHGLHAIHEFIVEKEIIHHLGEIGECCLLSLQFLQYLFPLLVRHKVDLHIQD